MKITRPRLVRPSWLPQWLSLPLVVVVAFFIMLLFFGDNNYLRISAYSAQVKDLKREIKAYEDTARTYEAKTAELNSDRETLERIAREKYGMKKANEDVYVTSIP